MNRVHKTFLRAVQIKLSFSVQQIKHNTNVSSSIARGGTIGSKRMSKADNR